MEEQSTVSTSKGNGAKIGAAVIGLLVIALVAYFLLQSNNSQQLGEQTQDQSAPTTAQQQTVPTEVQQTVETSADYKDGTYSAIGNYTSPGGQEELGVEITLENGVITASNVEVRATRPISKTRQTDFADNYKEFVEGKSIDEVALTKVSGSSLSPKGFNDALEQIKEEART